MKLLGSVRGSGVLPGVATAILVLLADELVIPATDCAFTAGATVRALEHILLREGPSEILAKPFSRTRATLLSQDVIFRREKATNSRPRARIEQITAGLMSGAPDIYTELLGWTLNILSRPR